MTGGITRIVGAAGVQGPTGPTGPTGVTGPALAPVTPVWTNPALAGSWVPFGGSNPTLSYHIDSLGFVWMRGAVKSGTGTITTLPAGARPLNAMVFIVMTGGGAPGQVQITNAGLVTFDNGTNTFVSFDGISFRAEL